MTIVYDVTIDDTAVGALENVAEICVAEVPTCDSDEETVTPEPSIQSIVRLPVCDGDVPYLSYDVRVFGTDADTLTMTWLNPTGDDVVYSDLPLSGKVLWPGAVVDAEGQPLDWPAWRLVDGVWVEGDEFDWVRPSVDVLFQVNPEETVTVAYPPSMPECNANPPEPGLFIDKSNDAPIETIDLGDGTTADLPYADEEETVTFTLDYSITLESGVTNAVITDVLPNGLTYVDGSAVGDAQFTFIGYDEATRTLRWEADSVTVDGAVSYDVTIDKGASELQQPLENVATIDSDQTEPDDADSYVYTGSVPLDLTPPPTDTIGSRVDGETGPGLLLVLLAISGLALSIGVLTPIRVRARRTDRRR